jgi:hypothetical protein
MKFIETHTNMRIAGRYDAGVNYSNWHEGPIWFCYVARGSYYAFVHNRYTGGSNDYWSVVSQQLYPIYQVIDSGDNVVSSLRVMPYYHDGYPVYQHISGSTAMMFYRSGEQYIAMKNETYSGYVGYAPDDEDEYWIISHSYIQNMTGKYSPFASGTMTPQGTATTSYTIRTYWPRWELQGYNLVDYSRYEIKAGLYQPCDGVSGQFKIGHYDISTGDWVHDFGWTRELYMGENVTWR